MNNLTVLLLSIVPIGAIVRIFSFSHSLFQNSPERHLFTLTLASNCQTNLSIPTRPFEKEHLKNIFIYISFPLAVTEECRGLINLIPIHLG